MSSCLDLREFQNKDAIQDAFSKIVSGKKGYKAVIEQKVEPLKCQACGTQLDPIEKFCHECGAKVEKKA
jgi:uncharacterized OB-fold protein